MIASLRGQVAQRGEGHVVVDVAGVGYLVQVPLHTARSLPSLGQDVLLHIHTHVREDAIQLFGFSSSLELFLFDKLLLVNGVGPRLAIAALSGIEPRELLRAIVNGEAKRLSSVSGIGKKTAERIVLELSDKLASLPSAGTASGGETVDGSSDDDVLSALLNLGYRRKEAESALAQARPASAPGFEALFKSALAHLARRPA